MKKSLFILFFIKENAPKKNGLCTVLIRLTIEKEYLSFSTKLDVDPKSWNKDTGRVKVKKQEINEQNVYLDDLHRLVTEKYDKLFDKGGIITPQQLKDAVFNVEVEEDPNTILSIFSKHNEDMSRLVGREVVKSTHTRYVKTLSRLKQFLLEEKKVDDMPIKDVTPMFIRDFEIYLKTTGKCTDNLTAKSLKQFKKIVGIAIDNNLISGNPFANIKLHFTYEERNYLTQNEVDKMMQKKFSVKRLEQVRDMFIFSCYTGLAYTDLAHLRAEDIRESFDGKMWVMIKRQKTNVPANILLLDIPAAILTKYQGKLENDAIMPVISNQKVNAYLKEIADVCGIDKVLTFHVARHTFSTTITLANGVPIETVSKMLGHTNLKTTQIYARITNSKIGHDMEMLAEKLNNKNRVAISK